MVNAVSPDVQRRRVDGDLVARLTPPALAAARHTGLALDDQLDAVQDGWALLLAHLHTIRDPTHLRGWLVTTVRRRAAWLLRRRQRESLGGQYIMDTEATRQPSAEECWLAADRDRLLWAAVASLPDRERRLAELVAHHPGLTCRELAERIGVSPSAASRIRRRLLARLRRRLALAGITGL